MPILSVAQAVLPATRAASLRVGTRLSAAQAMPDGSQVVAVFAPVSRLSAGQAIAPLQVKARITLGPRHALRTPAVARLPGSPSVPRA